MTGTREEKGGDETREAGRHCRSGKAHGPYSVWDRKTLEGFELGVIFKNHCGSCVETGLLRLEAQGGAVQMGDDGGQNWGSC